MDNRHFHEPGPHQAGVAAHEAGHVVFSLLFQGHHGHATASIWPEGNGWSGVARPLWPQPGDKFLPPVSSTPPHEWQKHVRMGWAGLVEIWGGAAACRHFEGLWLDADSIRDDDSASYGDTEQAQEIATHFWPPAQVETILDRSAEVAGELVQQPAVWLAIRRVADYLAIRRNCHVTELETIVRRHLPGTIECPQADWAVALAKR